MCIIVAKDKGIELPTKRTLQQCFERNKDGAGIMYVKNGKVIIEKGLMTFQDFYKKLKDIKREFGGDLTDKAIVMHFRIGTKGENDKATTHPFPISNKFEDLRATHFETDIAMVHNGIMSSYNYDKILSDTQVFIRDYVSAFKELNDRFYLNDRIMKIISDKANMSSNKLCFLDKDENIHYFGNKVIENGIIYSNDTFREPKNTSYGYYSGGYSWYDYDRYYDDYDYWYGYSKPKQESKLTISKFIEDKIKYEILEYGDFYQTLSGADFVEKNETIIIDENKNLYELVGDHLSLIGTKATIYDKNWKVKNLKLKLGETTLC